MKKQSIIILSISTAVALLVSIAPFFAVGAEAKTITANVVALDQRITYNRLGVVTPNGMIFALERDVVPITPPPPGCDGVSKIPGCVQLRPDKRPRPIVLRMNVDDIMEVHFTNLVAPVALDEQPITRAASVHAMGMEPAGDITSDGTNVGNVTNALVEPGQTKTYKFTAGREGGYLLYSNGAIAGGEAETGGMAIGLLGSVNVQARGAEYYRSQVTNNDLVLASMTLQNGQPVRSLTPGGHPIIDYNARYPAVYPNIEPFITQGVAGQPTGKTGPILNMLDGTELVHTDINAIITGPRAGPFRRGTYPQVAAAVPSGSDDATTRSREEPFREFTIIFHDEIHALQAFPQFNNLVNLAGQDLNPLASTLHSVRDGFAVNYGTGGIGAEIIANRLGVGPMADCTECKYEEFFLTSWTVGDPAMITDRLANANVAPGVDPGSGVRIPNPIPAEKALFPDDPSNVFHAYLNDHVKMRNIHAGKEHHMFHLHAHQWLFTPDDDNSSYLDVQGIGPGSSYTYEITYNGTGNRNGTVGDAIFHCHFYPHFAQGMWALYRAHDVFEEGTVVDNPVNGKPVPGARALPDGEILAGSPIPAIVPLPGRPMAPMPGLVTVRHDANQPGSQTDLSANDGRNPGFPFFIPGLAGHRPPHPPLDTVEDGGLPRHVVSGLDAVNGGPNNSLHVETRLNFDKKLLAIQANPIPEAGAAVEQLAMDFHALRFHPTFLPDGTPAGAAPNDPSGFKTNGLPRQPGAPYADPCVDDSGNPAGIPRNIKAAVIQLDLVMNKVGWHFPQQRILAHWQDVDAIESGTKPPEPFYFRANSDDCITYYHTNLLPNVYELDDYQVRTPTDIIGQHIHLVKFDVTSSDGSGNGWNYEDGTFSPQEVIERIEAINAAGGLGGQTLAPRLHPSFANHRLGLGAQTTIQRWYADPTVNNSGQDRTLGTVFTHDHFGPSTHQQAGLYAFLGIEPKGSVWRNPETGETFGNRPDGGPTSFRADIIAPNPEQTTREFFMFVADFQPAYAPGALQDVTDVGIVGDQIGNTVIGRFNHELVVAPPVKAEAPLPIVFEKSNLCADLINVPPCPEAIMAADEGTFVVNFRNEPIPHRVWDPSLGTVGPFSEQQQALGQAGDLAFAYRSDVTRAIAALNSQPASPLPLTLGVQPGDPFTPLMRAYQGDKIMIRLGTGATEESHNATIHGIKWLQNPFSPNSGFRNSQHLGIAEHFEIVTPMLPDPNEAGPFTDHLYKLSAAVDGQWNGAWGILRAYDRDNPVDLLPLPTNLPRPSRFTNARNFEGVCPRTARVRRYDIAAVAASQALPINPVTGTRTLVYNSRTASPPAPGSPGSGIDGPLHDPAAIVFFHTDDLNPDGTLKPGVPIEPLILRAAAGECIDVTLHNRLPADAPLLDPDGHNSFPMIVDHFNANQVDPSKHIGLHPQLVAYDVTKHDGTNVGLNSGPVQTAAPGQSVNYRWYAGTLSVDAGNRLVATPVEFGATNLMPAEPLKHSNKGAVGALIIEPRNARWRVDANTRAAATVTGAGAGTFREFVLIFQDDVNLYDAHNVAIPAGPIEEDSEDIGKEAFNYRTEPLWWRLNIPPDPAGEEPPAAIYTTVLSNSQIGGADPETPVFTARARSAVRMRILKPGGHARNNVFVMSGHAWERMPYISNSTRIGSNRLSEWRGAQEGIGPSVHHDMVLKNGAGGKNRVKGDYLYRDFSPFTFVGGLWGILRVQ